MSSSSRLYRSGIHFQGTAVSGTVQTARIPLQVGKDKCALIKRVIFSLAGDGFSNAAEAIIALMTQWQQDMDYGDLVANEDGIARSQYAIACGLFSQVAGARGETFMNFEMPGRGFEVIQDCEIVIDSAGGGFDMVVSVYYEVCKVGFGKWAEIAADTVKFLHRTAKQGKLA